MVPLPVSNRDAFVCGIGSPVASQMLETLVESSKITNLTFLLYLKVNSLIIKNHSSFPIAFLFEEIFELQGKNEFTLRYSFRVCKEASIHCYEVFCLIF